MLVQLASGGDEDVEKVTHDAHLAAVISSDGDALSANRLAGGWFNRKMLGTKVAKAEQGRIRHNPDLYSQLAMDAGHGYVNDATMGFSSARTATRMGHLSSEHATIGDNYDMFKLRAGVGGVRRRLIEGLHSLKHQLLPGRVLVEESTSKVDPESMAMMGQLMTQDAIRDATSDRGTTRFATKMGREGAVIGTVDHGLDTLFHVGEGELPEGELTRGDKKLWDSMPTGTQYGGK